MLKVLDHAGAFAPAYSDARGGIGAHVAYLAYIGGPPSTGIPLKASVLAIKFPDRATGEQFARQVLTLIIKKGRGGPTAYGVAAP